MIDKHEMQKMKNFLRMIPLEVFIDDDEDIDMEPVRIEKHGRTTVVFWADGTATAVRRQAEDEDNEYAAFCAAVTKRVYGSNSQIKSIIRELTEVHMNVSKEAEGAIVTDADAMEDIGKALDAFSKAFSKALGIDDACPVDKPCKEEKSSMDWEQATLNEKAQAQYAAYKLDMWTCPNCGKTYPWQNGRKGRFATCFRCNTAAQQEAKQ